MAANSKQLITVLHQLTLVFHRGILGINTCWYYSLLINQQLFDTHSALPLFCFILLHSCQKLQPVFRARFPLQINWKWIVVIVNKLGVFPKLHKIQEHCNKLKVSLCLFKGSCYLKSEFDKKCQSVSVPIDPCRDPLLCFGILV